MKEGTKKYVLSFQCIFKVSLLKIDVYINEEFDHGFLQMIDLNNEIVWHLPSPEEKYYISNDLKKKIGQFVKLKVFW